MKSVFVLLFRNEKLELQTAMALSLSKEDPSELPSPSSKPQEPKKHKSEDRGNNGEFTANETAALADFPVLAGSQEVASVVDKSKETKKLLHHIIMVKLQMLLYIQKMAFLL